MKKLIKGFELILIMALKGGGAVLNLVMTYYLMNTLNAEDSGIFFFMISMVYITAYFSRYGSDNYIVREVSAGFVPEDRNIHLAPFISSLYIFSFLVSLFLPIFFIMIAKQKGYEIPVGVIALLSAASFFFSISQINSRVLQGQRKVISSSFVMSVGAPLIFVIEIIMLLAIDSNQSSLEKVSAAYLISFLIMAMLSTRYIYLCRFKLGGIISSYKQASSFFVTGFISVLILWGGQVVSGFILDLQSVSILAASQRIAMSINLVVVASSMYISPLISQAYAKGELGKIRAIIYNINSFSLVIGSLVLVCIFFWASKISEFFNIPEDGKGALLILCVAQVMNVVTGNSVQILNMTKNQRLTRYSVFAGGGVFMVGTAVSFMYPSLMSVALTISLSLISQNLMAAFFVHKKLGFSPLGISFRRTTHDQAG